jgi:hypothetical protein
MLQSRVVSDLAEWLGCRIRDVLHPIVLRAGHGAHDGRSDAEWTQDTQDCDQFLVGPS